MTLTDSTYLNRRNESESEKNAREAARLRVILENALDLVMSTWDFEQESLGEVLDEMGTTKEELETLGITLWDPFEENDGADNYKDPFAEE